jgi:hypothetical protein
MSMLKTILHVSEVYADCSVPMVADGIAIMKTTDDFEVVHLMMARDKMEELILQVLNEQYLGDDNTLVPRMITEILLASDRDPEDSTTARPTCWETLATATKKKVNEHW